MRVTTHTIVEYSDGNPGAMTAMMEILNMHDKDKSDTIWNVLHECKSIRGTNMHVLWSDLCNRDANKLYSLVSKCPKDVLEDAASRQDYSGAELVKEYL
jgi:hypothetical protein